MDPRAVANPVPRHGRIDEGLDHVAESIARSREHILSLQHEDGYWFGELEADAMLEADYIFAHFLLGTGDPERLQRERVQRIEYGMRYIRPHQ